MQDGNNFLLQIRLNFIVDKIRTSGDRKKATAPVPTGFQAKQQNLYIETQDVVHENKKQAFQAGMNAHIAKPIDIKTILAAFDQVFGAT